MAEDLSDYELLRQKNIQENFLKMKELGLFKEDFTERKSKIQRSVQRTKSEVVRRYSDPTLLNAEKRRSRRLASRKVVQFTDEVSKLILGEEDSCSVSLGEDYDYGSGEELSDCELELRYRKPMRRKSMREHGYKPRGNPDKPREILSVDEITEDHLSRVVEYVRDKVYSQDGTTCHQCRQKTIDQKTICRSDECFGVRGQFCGPCLKNRYGESVVEALKDPEWKCPPCRHMCNCSICRTQAGKVPTGQLTYLALERGYQSVKDLLEKEDDE